MIRPGRASALAAFVLTLGSSPPARSEPAGTSLLYLAAAEWDGADRVAKRDLATDFMRIYCGDLRMPVDRLVDCLDEASRAATKFEQALACVSRSGG